MIATTTCMAPPPAFCLQRHIPPTRNQPTHSEHWTNNVNSSPRRGTPPCDGVEQKTCLSGASLFCVRHRASTGVCLRSRPNGVGARGAEAEVCKTCFARWSAIPIPGNGRNARGVSRYTPLGLYARQGTLRRGQARLSVRRRHRLAASYPAMYHPHLSIRPASWISHKTACSQ